MANGMKARPSRRRGKVWWMAAVIAVAYIFLAQQPLLPAQKLVFVDAEPRPLVETRGSKPPDGAWEAEGRYFIARGDLQGVSEVDRSGKRLWTSEFPSTVTAVDVTAERSAWGLLDGSIHLINSDGTTKSVVKPASMGVSSRFACVYGLALSPGGTKLAVLFGLDPQHFAVFERKGDDYGLLYDMKLVRSLRSAQSFAFSADGKGIMGLTGDGMVFYDVKMGRAAALEDSLLRGDLEISLVPAGADGFAFLAAIGNGRYAGLFRQGRVEALFPVEAGSTGILAEGQNVAVLGKDTLYRYKVENK